MIERIPIASIRVGERRRQDLGDIAALAEETAILALENRLGQEGLSDFERSRTIVALFHFIEKQERRNQLQSLSWVYFIREGYPQEECQVKIGFSSDPGRRCSELQVGRVRKLRLLGVIPGGPEVERALHRHFVAIRIRGEWFQYTPNLQRFIRENARPWSPN